MMQPLICPLEKVEEVYKNGENAVYQCSRKNCYWLEFLGSTTSFSVSDFFQFKRNIDAINIDQMIADNSRHADFEIIMPFRTERCFILSVAEIITLRELLCGAKFSIELNSVVNSCLHSCMSIIH